MVSAISTSSVWSRGFLWPRYWVFSRHTGSSTWAEISSNWSPMPPTAFSAFSSRAEAAPRVSEVLPVTTRPSGSTMAPAGPPVVSAFSRAADTAGQMSGVTLACCITSSSFRTGSSPALPRSRSTQAV